jgi:AcrR family transcriptional regulator
MGAPEGSVRRRSDGWETRRRVLDAVVETIVEVGYYKASSNQIARRAGVTWGAIDHLFGSREQLMLEVFHDLGEQAERYFAAARIKGASLEDRLHSVLAVFDHYYDGQPRYLVETQILLDLASNPRVSEETRKEMRRSNAERFPPVVRDLLTQALGKAAPDDLCVYAFTALHGYIASRVMLGLSVELPDDSELRDRMVQGVAHVIRSAAEGRGIAIDESRGHQPSSPETG